jgi:hypothetical protein
MRRGIHVIAILISVILCSCAENKKKEMPSNQIKEKQVTAKDILGNPDYMAVSYGGYRQKSRDAQPTIEELKDDMKILSAMGVKILRTYNVQLQQN